MSGFILSHSQSLFFITFFYGVHWNIFNFAILFFKKDFSLWVTLSVEHYFSWLWTKYGVPQCCSGPRRSTYTLNLPAYTLHYTTGFPLHATPAQPLTWLPAQQFQNHMIVYQSQSLGKTWPTSKALKIKPNENPCKPMGEKEGKKCIFS